MAKSKSGGTRSYIRGKIGADVYSVGKDGKGKRQQVVRSLAEQVANPQTEAQMFGRMVMSTVMQAVSAMKPIIDHSFDGVPAGQPSISEFIRRNYALVKADAVANPSTTNTFGLAKYQEKGVHRGGYIISKGNVTLPTAIEFDKYSGSFTITLTSAAHKVSDLKAALAIASGDDYFTLCGFVGSSNEFVYVRLRINPALADATDITASNVGQVFLTEGNVTPTFGLDNYVISVAPGGSTQTGNGGIIVSRKNTDGWQHSTCYLENSAVNLDWNANQALPTYPQGNARFLNGGDI